MDPTYPLVPVANFLGFILTLVPLLSMDLLRKWNTGVCMFAIWVAVMSIITAVNTIIWSDNVNNVAPVWCNITTRIGVGSFPAIPACSLVITRRLSKIIRNREFASTRKEKRAELIFDLSLTLGLPVLIMAIYYIVQGAEFQIYEELGCVDAPGAPGLSTILLEGWSILLPAVSVLFYCPRIIWVLYHHRKEANEFLDSNSSMERINYYRIMALGCFDAFITLPVHILSLVGDLQGSFPFWPGWTWVHTDFSVISVTLTSKWAASGSWAVFHVKYAEWINPFFALVFFLVFGLTGSARESYRRAFWAIMRPIGVKRPVRTDGKLSEIHFGSAPATSSISGSGLHDLVLPANASEVSSEIDREKIGPGDIDAEEDMQFRTRVD